MTEINNKFNIGQDAFFIDEQGIDNIRIKEIATDGTNILYYDTCNNCYEENELFASYELAERKLNENNATIGIGTLKNAFATHDESYLWEAYMIVYCEENDVMEDTAEWDNLVATLYKVAKDNHNDFDLSYKDFDNLLYSMVVCR